MASKLPEIKNCKCGKPPALIELGHYHKCSIKGCSMTKKTPSLFYVECVYCQVKPMFKSGSKRAAIETWHRGASCK